MPIGQAITRCARPDACAIAHLEANVAAADLVLDDATIAELEAAFPVGSTVGNRFPASPTVKVAA